MGAESSPHTHAPTHRWTMYIPHRWATTYALHRTPAVVPAAAVAAALVVPAVSPGPVLPLFVFWQLVMLKLHRI